MTVAVIEATLKQALLAKGMVVDSSNDSLGELTSIAQKSLLFNNRILNELRGYQSKETKLFIIRIHLTNGKPGNFRLGSVSNRSNVSFRNRKKERT